MSSVETSWPLVLELAIIAIAVLVVAFGALLWAARGPGAVRDDRRSGRRRLGRFVGR